MGRVFAVQESLLMAGLAIGSLATPGVVDWLGPRGALIAAGSVLPVLLVWLWPSLRRIDAAAVIAEEPLEAAAPDRDLRATRLSRRFERLAAGATSVSVEAGQVVVSRGETGRHFYAIASGKAAVELDDGTTRELGPGDFFGEIALLRDVPRTATVRAIEPLKIYAVEREEFIAAVTGHAPTLAKPRRERRDLGASGRRTRCIARGCCAPARWEKELRGPESAVSGPLHAALVFDALDEAPTSCARARRRPARAQCGLRLSPRCADLLSLRPFAPRGSSVSNPQVH